MPPTSASFTEGPPRASEADAESNLVGGRWAQVLLSAASGIRVMQEGHIVEARRFQAVSHHSTHSAHVRAARVRPRGAAADRRVPFAVLILASGSLSGPSNHNSSLPSFLTCSTAVSPHTPFLFLN